MAIVNTLLEILMVSVETMNVFSVNGNEFIVSGNFNWTLICFIAVLP